eukprot:scaffold13882_cov31-Tisochrysis_lutea.AAC.9
MLTVYDALATEICVRDVPHLSLFAAPAYTCRLTIEYHSRPPRYQRQRNEGGSVKGVSVLGYRRWRESVA